MSRSALTEHSFIVLMQKCHNLCFENSGCKLLSCYKSANSSLAGGCVASWNFNCVWLVDRTFPESKSKMLLKLCLKLLTLVWNYSVYSQSSQP